MTFLLNAAEQATKRLGGQWHGSYGMAKCPAHNDKTPSLSIQAGHSAVLYHCFAGCSNEAVIAALRTGGFRSDIADERRPTAFDRTAEQKRRALALDIWDKARSVRNTPAALYLERRGIHANGHCRFDPASKTNEIVDGERRTLTFPALVLPIHDDTQLVAIQRVFLTDEGAKAAISAPKKILGSVGGGAIRLGAKPRDILNLAEGFEDAQSAIQMNGLSHCWAVAGTARYGLLDIPDSVQRIRIFSQHGPEAAQAIESARDHLTAMRRSLEVIMPPGGGDWNDAVVKE